MLEKGKRIPNWNIKDVDGKSHDLWDYRQKAHLILIYEPESSQDTRGRWQKAVQADNKQWTWLDAKVILVDRAPKEMAPGTYLVDRYGMFLNYFSPGHWSFDDLERELVYYEAAHC